MLSPRRAWVRGESTGSALSAAQEDAAGWRRVLQEQLEQVYQERTWRLRVLRARCVRGSQGLGEGLKEGGVTLPSPPPIWMTLSLLLGTPGTFGNSCGPLVLINLPLGNRTAWAQRPLVCAGCSDLIKELCGLKQQPAG